MSQYHTPVLLEESVGLLGIDPAGTYVDLTFGGGGHSRRILEELGPEGRLYAFDQDRDTLANAPDDARFRYVESNFRFLRGALRLRGVTETDGILADLGVSSHHFDAVERGFSFRGEAPLDMRMNQRGGLTAAKVVNSYPAQTLTQLLGDWGELDTPWKVANCIVRARETAPIQTTAQLVEAVRPCTPKKDESKFLTKLFQALRIEVNGEMEALKMALEALRDIGDKFKADYLINVLTGKTTALIKSYGHNKSKWFGAGAEHDVRFWGAVLRQALILGLVDKNIENYGLISVNRKGENFIAMPFPVTVTLDHDYDEEEKEAEAVVPMGKGGAADEELFAMLKDLRKKVAKQHGLPPFVIFQDPSLEDMAVQYPITIEEMQNITGVGVGKARKFGEEFIRLIRAYVEEKEIVRPQDMIVKSVGNKSGNKIFIIQAIDRKMDFEDIARAKDLDFDELLTEIEGIVNSGTKLDISYYIEQVIDEDKSNDIYLYFKEDAQSDSLDEAIEELVGDYTEEEIRLVRIKFMCEQGN